MDVSFIIPCHNEEKVIISKVNNTLELLDCVKEIIIVDDNSSDETFQIAKKLSLKNKKIRIFKNLEKGKNSAVILGLNKSKSEIICMTDADIIMPKDTLQKVLPYFEKQYVGMVSLSTKLLNDKNSNYSFIYEPFVRLIKIFESKIDSVVSPHGQALFFRKSLNLIPTRQADDVDLGIQTRKKGYKVKYAKDDFFEEKVVESIEKLKKQKIRRCKAVIDALLFHKDVLFNPKYNLFGFLCYPLDLAVYLFSPFIFLFLSTVVFLLVYSYFNIFVSSIVLTVFVFTLLFTKYRSILNLIFVNLSAIKEYWQQGKSESWKPPKRDN